MEFALGHPAKSLKSRITPALRISPIGVVRRKAPRHRSTVFLVSIIALPGLALSILVKDLASLLLIESCELE